MCGGIARPHQGIVDRLQKARWGGTAREASAARAPRGRAVAQEQVYRLPGDWLRKSTCFGLYERPMPIGVGERLL